MNRRLKELADQAELTIRTSKGTYMSHPEFNKKFAELIVRECIETMGSEIVYNDNYKERNTAISDMMMLIKKHFGVEE